MTDGQTQEWKTYFAELEDEGLFIGTDLDKSCLQFIYMEIIRSHIHQFVEVHNSHSIRYQRKREHYLPTGQPYMMYFYPESGKDYKEPVNLEILESLELEVAEYNLDQYLPSETLLLFGKFLEEGGYPKEYSYEDTRHKEAYVYLRQRVWQFVQEGGKVELFSTPSGAAEWINAHADHEVEQHRSHVSGDQQMEINNSDDEFQDSTELNLNNFEELEEESTSANGLLLDF